jgi:hypothetical protein
VRVNGGAWWRYYPIHSVTMRPTSRAASPENKAGVPICGGTGNHRWNLLPTHSPFSRKATIFYSALHTSIRYIKGSVLATSYSPFSSTIATIVLNFRVRNEIGCTHDVKSPTQSLLKAELREKTYTLSTAIIMFPNRSRSISTPRLNASLHFHLVPINVVVSYGSQMIPNLRVGFPLRCFQRLSVPDLATRQCSWRYSR